MGIHQSLPDVDISSPSIDGVRNEWSHTSISLCLNGLCRKDCSFYLYIVLCRITLRFAPFCTPVGSTWTAIRDEILWIKYYIIVAPVRVMLPLFPPFYAFAPPQLHPRLPCGEFWQNWRIYDVFDYDDLTHTSMYRPLKEFRSLLFWLYGFNRIAHFSVSLLPHPPPPLSTAL